MIKFIIFLVCVILIVSSFNIDLSFFTSGLSSILGNISTYSVYFFDFFKSIFNTLFSSSVLSFILSIGFAMAIIGLIVNSFIGKRGHDD